MSIDFFFARGMALVIELLYLLETDFLTVLYIYSIMLTFSGFASLNSTSFRSYWEP